MKNIYLAAFNPASRAQIPTPRLRTVLGYPNVFACDYGMLDMELARGYFPLYRIANEDLYEAEINYFPFEVNSDLYFCLPVSRAPFQNEETCNEINEELSMIFGLETDYSASICLKHVGNINPKKVDKFCATWDKSFHLMQSLLRVLASPEYSFTKRQKEMFSFAWAQVLSTANIRMDLDCDFNIQSLGFMAPNWLQKFSRNIVVVRTQNKMVSSSVASTMYDFLNRSYEILKDISVDMCQSFLEKAKHMPEYNQYQDKLNEWIDACKKMSSKSKNKIPFSAKVVFGIIGTLIMAKRLTVKK